MTRYDITLIIILAWIPLGGFLAYIGQDILGLFWLVMAPFGAIVVAQGD